MSQQEDVRGQQEKTMRKPRLTTRKGLIAALDIGSSKICCLIAKVEDNGRPSVIGIGHQLSRGVRGGAMVNMDEAELAILTAVHAAEKMSAETIDEVVVNLSGGYPASQTIGVEVAIAGHEVSDNDLRRGARAWPQHRCWPRPTDRAFDPGRLHD